MTQTPQTPSPAQTPLQMIAEVLAQTAQTGADHAEAEIAQYYADQCAAFPQWPQICAFRAEGERIARTNQAQSALKGL